MCKKLGNAWRSLNHSIVVNQRELVLGVAACTVLGVLVGMLLSPRKTVTIASNNGNNSTSNASEPVAGDVAEDDSSDEEIRED